MVNDEIIEAIKKKAREDNVPILQDKSLELIQVMLMLNKPKKILEVGTAVGYSALCFSRFLEPGGKIITLELSDEMVSIARKNIEDAGMTETIKVIQGDAYESMQQLNETFDVVFIDAAKGQYMKYLEQAMRLTASGSVIIADNVLFKGRVLGEYNEHKHRTAVNRLREYIKTVKEDDRLDTAIVDVGDGLAISAVK